MFKKLLFVFLMALSTHVFSDPFWHTTTINIVYPLGNGNFVLMFKEDNPGCTAAGDYHYAYVGVNGMTAEGLKNIYSAALTAAAAGKPVAVNSDMLGGNYCYINRLYVDF